VQIIAALYAASQAGVEIDLIVRGICCLRPGMPGVSEHIRVRSIIGRFLEHSRILAFGNAGHPEYYIGSADWMPRNLDRRVEVMAPIEDASLHKLVRGVLETCLRDNRQAWALQADGRYVRLHPTDDEPSRGTHVALMHDPWGLGGDATGAQTWEGDLMDGGSTERVPDGGRVARSGKRKGKGTRP